MQLLSGPEKNKASLWKIVDHSGALNFQYFSARTRSVGLGLGAPCDRASPTTYLGLRTDCVVQHRNVKGKFLRCYVHSQQLSLELRTGFRGQHSWKSDEVR